MCCSVAPTRDAHPAVASSPSTICSKSSPESLDLLHLPAVALVILVPASPCLAAQPVMPLAQLYRSCRLSLMCETSASHARPSCQLHWRCEAEVSGPVQPTHFAMVPGTLPRSLSQNKLAYDCTDRSLASLDVCGTKYCKSAAAANVSRGVCSTTHVLKE